MLDSGSFTLRDNGSATRTFASLEGKRLDVQVEGVQRWLALRLLPLPGVAAVDAVYVNGAMLDKVEALERGARLLCGGKRPESVQYGKGFFYSCAARG